MISLKVDNLKGELNQQLYDEYINLIDVHSLMCTCGNHDNVIHGYYKRKVRTDKINTELRIVRVKCKCCDKSDVFLDIVSYINTEEEKQQKGIGGYAK